MARTLVVTGAAGMLLVVGLMLVKTQGLVPASFGCRSSYLSEVSYCD